MKVGARCGYCLLHRGYQQILRSTDDEAVRKAFNEVVPREWVDYVSKQGDEVRSEMIDRLAEEFTTWLRGVDPARILGDLLENYEISATVRLSAEPRRRSGDRSESAVPIRKPKE